MYFALWVRQTVLLMPEYGNLDTMLTYTQKAYYLKFINPKERMTLAPNVVAITAHGWFATNFPHLGKKYFSNAGMSISEG